MKNVGRILTTLALGLTLAASTHASGTTAEPAPGAGARGLAIKARKVLAVPLEGRQYYDNAVILVREGKIEAVGTAAETPIPAGYEVMDVGEQWVMPGIIELHSHVAGTFDLNEPVYMTNPGLRAWVAVRPEDPKLKMAIAGGVTTLLMIPGSGCNMSGQGVLVKTGHDTYEEMLIRNPGSLKIAQAGNPEGYLMGVNMSFMNWSLRSQFLRGVAYAKEWEAYEQGRGEQPERSIQHDIFRELYAKRTQAIAHSQVFQVVNNTLSLFEDTGIPLYIGHSTFDGYVAAPRAVEMGIAATVGPRTVDLPTWSMRSWCGTKTERIQGCAAGYQEAGMEMISFNTDAPVLPQEELSLQGAMAQRYGFKGDKLQVVRGLTCIPAKMAGIDNRIGSIEVGKDADLLVLTGNPADPRTSIELVLQDGERVYDPQVNKRRW